MPAVEAGIRISATGSTAIVSSVSGESASCSSTPRRYATPAANRILAETPWNELRRLDVTRGYCRTRDVSIEEGAKLATRLLVAFMSLTEYNIRKEAVGFQWKTPR